MSIQGIQSQPVQKETYNLSEASQVKKNTKTEISEENQPKEICIASTDRVDAELTSLKTREAQLASKLSSVDKNSPEYGTLEQELTQVENELRLKNNDTYRRQHTDFSSGVDIEA